jgi:lipopolysaccharide/colanic/teichoic acid biosynthesis glycosyltransferase
LISRAFDFFSSLLILLIFSPLFPIIALLIKLDSPGEVFYRARRAGKHGKIFRLYKFRSMTTGAAEDGPGITAKADPRVTRTGRWLRRYKLDELPQLINVLRGEMSLVGPRPEDPRFVARYTPQQRRVLEVRPGITSPASLKFRDEENLLEGADWEVKYIQRIMPEKIRLELEYLQKRSFWSDMGILWRTAWVLFGR